MKSLAIVCLTLLISTSAFASVEIVCADSNQNGFIGDAKYAAENLNSKLEKIADPKSVSAPAIAVDPLQHNTINSSATICVTVTK